MASRKSTNGKKLLERIKLEHRKLCRYRYRYAAIYTKIAQQEKTIDSLVSKMSNEDVTLYREQFEKMNLDPRQL